MANKKVSVITGTYNRPIELAKCIKYVQNQTYPNIEHCIVHDGPAIDEIKEITNYSNIKFVETGRQWSQFLSNSISAVPYQVAQWLASGDYITWLADDEEITEDHIEKLVTLLETEDVDFVYSMSEIWFSPELGKSLMPRLIGNELPRNGNITQALFRAELLDYRGFMTHVGSGTDIDQVATWIEAGASWAFLPEVTHTHRVDKFGDGNLNQIKQPLKGHAREKSQYHDYANYKLNDLTIVRCMQDGYAAVRCVCMNDDRYSVAKLGPFLRGDLLNCGVGHETESNRT